MKTVFKIIICSSFAFILHNQAFAWELVSENDDAGAPPCSKILRTVEASDGSSLQVSAADSEAGPFGQPETLDHFNQGSSCTSNNSSSVFGGYFCQESRSEGRNYMYAYCQTSVGFFKCSPFENDNYEETYSFDQKTLTTTAHWPNANAAGSPINQICTYQ